MVCILTCVLLSLSLLQQAPDYRLYKSEPELTTVKEEVDEANAEDKDKMDPASESRETVSSKGVRYNSTI